MPRELQEQLDYIQRQFRMEGYNNVVASWDEVEERYTVQADEAEFLCVPVPGESELLFESDDGEELTMELPSDPVTSTDLDDDEEIE